jgi:hypothetical protein
MNELFSAATSELVRWLGEKLPTLGANWWTDNVVSRLTFQQQRLVEERRITSLADLDLAAALRVLDQNWRELSDMTEPLPRDARNWIKELQGARNRWAHAPSAPQRRRQLPRCGHLGPVAGVDGVKAHRLVALQATKTKADHLAMAEMAPRLVAGGKCRA